MNEYPDWLREAHDRALERARELAALVREMTDQEVRDHVDLVLLAFNYAAEGEYILARRQQEQSA
jgi:hypothetical protein